MARYVYSVDMVAHIWAHQSQESARNQTGNFYFRGDTIYSYGEHFPIAKIYKRKKKTVVLFTTRGYSSTTAKHKRIVAGACSHLDVIECHTVDLPAGDDLHGENVMRFRHEITALAQRAMRARSNAAYLWESVSRAAANANAMFFGLLARFSVPNAENIQEHLKREAEREKRKAKQDAKRQAILILQQEQLNHNARQLSLARLDQWMRGEYVELHFLHYRISNEPVRLRIKGENVETSAGAEFPLAHALRALPAIRAGIPYKANGHSIHLGHFVIDEIDVEGNVKAGCHYVTREEIERIAAQLGK